MVDAYVPQFNPLFGNQAPRNTSADAEEMMRRMKEEAERRKQQQDQNNQLSQRAGQYARHNNLFQSSTPTTASTAPAPAGATQPYGQGMGMFRPEAVQPAAPYGEGAGVFPASPTGAAGGSSAAPASGGVGAVAAPAAAVAAGVYGMKRYSDLGWGNPQDFIKGDWTGKALNGSGFTKGLHAGNLTNAIKSGADLFMQGQGTNPMNPMSWLQWGKQIGNGLKSIFHF